MSLFQDFIKKSTDKSYKNNKLFTIPMKEKPIETPHIKNNIREANYLHQVDLLYLPTDKFGYKYAVVVVDVFNSKSDAEPLKSKTSLAVKGALEKIYKRNILEYPILIQFDSGSEFKGQVKTFFNEKSVSVKYTLTNRHRQNSIVEHKNKDIGGIIMKFQNMLELEKNKPVKEWVKYLPEIIEHLNKNIPKQNEKTLLDGDIQTTKRTEELLKIGDKVLVKLDYSINAFDKTKLDEKFRSGDIRWNPKIRTIGKIILNPNMPPMYQLNEIDKDKIDNSVAFTRLQLLLV